MIDTYSTGWITATKLSGQHGYPKKKKMKMNLCHIAFIGRCETRCQKNPPSDLSDFGLCPNDFKNRSLGEGSRRPRQVIGTALTIPLKPRKIAATVTPAKEDPMTV
jgi:hypothetical protein